MKNIPEVKVGLVAVSRDCFPESLSVNRRKALVLRAEEGCILLARDSLSTREIVKVIAFLDEIVTSMAEQLAKKSDEMASLQEEDDPLNAFDEDEIDTLEDFCINLEGLRSLLAMEDGRDE